MPKTRYTGRHRPAAKPSRGRQFVVPVALLSTTVAGGLVARAAGASELPQAAAMKNVSNSTALDATADSGAVAAAANRTGSRSSRDMARDAKTLIVGASQSATQSAAQTAAQAAAAAQAKRDAAARAIAQAHRWVSSVAGYTLTSGFGLRWGKMHPAQDLACPVGSPVHALSSGTVVFAGWSTEGYGNLVKIRYWDGTVSWMAHNSRLLVAVGDAVSPGQPIAFSGSTGHSTGPHVHLEIHPGDGSAVVPTTWLAARGVTL